MKKNIVYVFFSLFLFLICCCDVSASIMKEEIMASKEDGIILTYYNPNNANEGTDWESIRTLEDPVEAFSDIEFNTGVCIFASKKENSWSQLARAVFPFDTTNIPQNAIIKSAKLHIFGQSKENNGPYDKFDVNFYSVNLATTTELSKQDFNNFGSVPFSKPIIYDDIVIGNDNIFELNEDGIDYIKKGGTTVFGMRNASYDVANVEPSWVSYNRALFKVHYSESPDISKRPYLEITYELPEKAPLILIPGMMGSWPVDGELTLDPILYTYHDLWEALKLAGYTEGEDLFAFPYEWRESNVVTADLLAERIEDIREMTGREKVDIVAHSMGGLVAREYLSRGDNVENVDQLVFLATPQRGASEAYLTWEGGLFGEGFSGLMKSLIFTQEAFEAGYRDVHDYLRGEEIYSVRELLPVYDYLKDDQDLRVYPADCPRNLFLENLNTEMNLDKLNDLDVLNLVAIDGSDTIDYIELRSQRGEDMWEYGWPKSFEYGLGDGTVPNRSNYFDFDFSTFSIEAGHSAMVSLSQGQVIEELTGEVPSEIVSTNRKDYRLLLAQVFSPVDMQIVNSAGEMSGKDFVSASDQMEIAGSYYRGHEAESEFVTILDPATDTYSVNLRGVSDGKYRLLLTYIDENGEQSFEHAGKIKKDEESSLVFSFDRSNPQIEIENSDVFEKFRISLQNLYKTGDISEEKYQRYLNRVDLLEKSFESYELEGKGWKQRFLKQKINFYLKLFKVSLKIELKKEEINKNAYNDLKSILGEIRNML